ncbi:MAG: ABC transporter permease, partial [Pseudomonadota bacterium]
AFDAMQKWNAYRLRAQNRHIHAMSVLAPDEGVFGVGLAEVLGLCREKKTVTCKSVQLEPADADIAEDRDLDAGDPDPTLRTFLDRIAANGDKQAADETGADLLVATANGAPNIVKVRLAGIERQPSKQLDDSYVRIPFEIARGLLFGRERDASSGIAVQFKTTRAAERSLPALREFIAAQSNELELIPLSDYNSFYDQAVNFFNIIYFSVSLIMGTVVAFMIANSVTTNIFERSTEIGVVRALGMSQRSVRSVFIIEGFVLALAGAVAGVALAMAIAAAVNAAHVQIVMPGQGAAATLFLPMGGIAGILSARVVASAIIVAGVASYLSSRYIGALDILSALRRI